ncbi:MAG: glycosyltransferase family 2 protein [Klebsiella michiganensis]|uniref:glycosyltransferase family 2 protein n=1 Tax=Klebsiella grimontii TaxID=2058152 RepID=UPI00290246EA|nr:glycosyltransferase family 2 protein [Klebsiella michiganensis]MDU1617556.1 glycosyltransferase family 2 protein [Klebsiella michiganensis]
MDQIDEKYVAIIIPMFNAEKTIIRAIESVFSQTYTHWHLYIINDCSTDSSLDIVMDSYQSDKITIINNDLNLGAAESRNVGLKYSNEEVIAFLDSDDQWLPDKLEKQMDAISKGYNIVLSWYFYDINNKRHIIKHTSNVLKKNSFLKKHFRVCFSSVCIKRSNENIYFKDQGHEDFIFLANYFDIYNEAYVIREGLVNYYVLNNSLSANKKNAVKWHFHILTQRYRGNPFKILYFFSWYIFNAISFLIVNR